MGTISKGTCSSRPVGHRWTLAKISPTDCGLDPPQPKPGGELAATSPSAASRVVLPLLWAALGNGRLQSPGNEARGHREPRALGRAQVAKLDADR